MDFSINSIREKQSNATPKQKAGAIIGTAVVATIGATGVLVGSRAAKINSLQRGDKLVLLKGKVKTQKGKQKFNPLKNTWEGIKSLIGKSDKYNKAKKNTAEQALNILFNEDMKRNPELTKEKQVNKLVKIVKRNGNNEQIKIATNNEKK